MAAQSHGRTKVFISYSHKDRVWLERLRVHLSPLARANLIEVWHDRMISPGARWGVEIERALAAARVAVLLVSADFFDSDFIAGTELPPLLKAAEEEGVVILPVILSASWYDKTPALSQYQAVNPEKPLIKLLKGEQEEVFVEVAKSVEYWLNRPPGAADGSGRVAAPGARPRARNDDSQVSMPGVVRYVLDACCPSLHRRLTTKVGLFKTPPGSASSGRVFTTS